MSNLEFCIARRKAELPAFLKVLKALPAGGLDYRPHPKARTAADLAWLLAAEEASLVSLLDSGRIDWQEQKPPASVDAIVSAFERSANAVNERLEKLGEQAWSKPGQFVVGGQVAWEDTVGNLVWGFLFDQIHHRGQLSTYLRPMGGKVPAIYGPSADDTGQ